MKLLEGIRVLDMSRLIPGPYVGMLLADMGADVIKMEEKNVGDYLRINRDPDAFGGQMPLFLWLNSQKRDIAVDIKSDEGKQVIYDLAKTCDVALEGARPGVQARLGLGYEDIKKHRPDVVFCSITGFGQDGPYAQLGTHGGAYDAVSGLAQPFQLKDGSYVQNRPYPHGLTYGSWLAAMSISAALVRAKTKGEGTYLDISCADATLMALGQEYLGSFNTGGEAWPDPNQDVNVKYCYYQTKDGRFMLIQAIEQHFWQHFCDVVGRPDLRDRGDWSRSRMDNSINDMELRAELIKIFATKDQAEWADLFVKHDIAGAPYYPASEVENSPLYKARKMVVQQDAPAGTKLKTVANAIKANGEDFGPRKRAPEKGEHTDEVLKEIGYTDQRISDLRAKGSVA